MENPKRADARIYSQEKIQRERARETFLGEDGRDYSRTRKNNF